MTEKRLFGRIFRSDIPSQVVEGVWLNIKEDSIFIESPQNNLAYDTWPLIHGEFNGMDKVTFVNASAGGGSSGSGGSWRRIFISYLLKGHHFTQDELIFTKVSLFSPALSNWIASEIGIEQIDPNSYKIPNKQEIFSVTHDSIEYDISIFYSHAVSHQKLEVEKKCVVSIASESPLAIAQLSELMRKLKRLILFLTNKNPEFSEYYLANEEHKGIELINTLQNLNEAKFPQNIEFKYYDLKDHLKGIFMEWMKHDDLDTIIELLQEKQYNTDMSFQNYFLNMCVAIESYHYIFKSTSVNLDSSLDAKAKKQDREIILKLILDKDLRERFSKRSERWQEPSYRQRLKTFKPSFLIIMGDSFSFRVNEMINSIVNTRNALAHTGKYKDDMSHVELFLVGKVIEFTLKNEIIKLLSYVPRSENMILDKASQHLSILANLNNYKKSL